VPWIGVPSGKWAATQIWLRGLSVEDGRVDITGSLGGASDAMASFPNLAAGFCGEGRRQLLAYPSVDSP
jgi:hypothetical protein